VGRTSFSLVQSVVGVVAGLFSIGGAVYSAVQYVKPARAGEIAAVVRDARTDQPLAGATVEILTPEDALVTTLTPAEDGRVRSALHDGAYRVRVIHPQFAGETRQVRVLAGETSEVRFQLKPRAETARRSASSPVDVATRAASDGAGAARRFFRRLGL
jgi:carboxypeptidase family protein